MADHRLAHRRDRGVDGGQQPVGVDEDLLVVGAELARRPGRSTRTRRRDSPAGGVEPDAERLEARPGPPRASSATTSDESRPPESSTPDGTSATMRRRTATRSASSTASRQSRARHPCVLGPAHVLGPPVDVVARTVPSGRDRCARWPGGSLRTPVEDRARRGDDRVERHVVVQRDRSIEVSTPPPSSSAGSARGEPQPARGLGEVERLDAQPVAAQGQHAGVAARATAKANMPWKRSTHAGPQLVEGLEQHLGVGRGEEAVAGALQLGAQLAVVVDAAVEDGGQAQLGVDHRLGAALGQVDDLQPAVAERGRARGVHAGAVRTAAVHGLGDPRDGRDVGVAPSNRISPAMPHIGPASPAIVTRV